MYILVLADDMTGALEVGAKFSSAGIHTLVSAKAVSARAVSAKAASTRAVQAVVFDTETRHMPSAEAGRAVHQFIAHSGVGRPRMVYKKTDSTLRGNISAELQALARRYPDWRIGYAPAYPALGRTVKSGVLYVDGVAVADTEFAFDALNPISTSSVAAILGPELACTIFDGETEAQLAEAARAILSDDNMRIAAGPAGLAQCLAAEIDVPRHSPPPLPFVRTCLVMNGSRHERSAIQMRQVEEPGWRILHREIDPGANPVRVAAENGRFVVEQVAIDHPDAVFVVGGDTSFAVVQALGLPPLWPIAEVVPGVPVTRIAVEDLAAIPGRKQDLYLITKAGGFGGPDILARVRAKLSDATGHAR